MFGSNKPSRNANAVVTGAGSGIGRAFALEIAARGGRVVCSDIDAAGLAETVALIEADGGIAWGFACDVGQLEEVETMADAAEKYFGQPIDLVINNAGIGTGGKRVGETSMEDWHATLDVNLWGVIHGCHVFAPRMRDLDGGGIINVGSTASFAAAPLMGPYNVSKAAVLALTETLAAEMAGTKIKVSALCPTFVQTNIVKNGRIDTADIGFASELIARTGRSPKSVVRRSLNGLDRGELYVLPQAEARAIWRSKRLMPVSYNRGTGLLARIAAR